MGMSFSRLGALAGAAVCIFTLSAVAGVQMLPGTPSNVDYLVVGSIATLLSLATMFAMLLITVLKLPNPFYRKRAKASRQPEPPQN